MSFVTALGPETAQLGARALGAPQGMPRLPELLEYKRAAPWCPHSKTAIKHALKAQPAGLVLDVGSFDGSDAILYAGAGHQVWSFEASPGKIDPIRAHIAEHGLQNNVTLFHYALSNYSGTAGFTVSISSTSASLVA